MRIVSLTIPKPTLSNEEEVKSVSLTIKSRSNGMQMIDSWPCAFPRYKFDLDDVLEISIYYRLRSESQTRKGSDEINLHSVIHFPCVLLDEIERRGKKQWILGLDRFGDCGDTSLVSELSVESALRQIRVMEEKAKKSFKISKIYLIFYSCNKTIMNIEEQLGVVGSIHSREPGLLEEAGSRQSKLEGFVSKDLVGSGDDSRGGRCGEGRNKSLVGIRPEDSVSRVSARTSNSNTIARTNLIKQSLTENCDSLSDAIEMINKYKNRSKSSLTSIRPVDSGSNAYNVSARRSGSLKSINAVGRSSSNVRVAKEMDYSSLEREESHGTGMAMVDSASVISRAISANTQKYLERKEQQEKLLMLQYYFSIWRQVVRKERSIKMSRKNVKIISGMVSLLRVFERNQMSKKKMFMTGLRRVSYGEDLRRRQLDLEQVTNEKSILAEKLNSVISDNYGKLQKLNESILTKERDAFELRKKLEYYDNMNSELRDQIEVSRSENRALAAQIKELREYIEDKDKQVESDKARSDKERQELEIILDRRKKEYTRQLEEIHFLNVEIGELKSMLSGERDEKAALAVENEELGRKVLGLEEEKMNIMSDFNQSVMAKSKENEQLYLENIKYKEENEQLIRSNHQLAEENSGYIRTCEELKSEKSSLIKSVYDLISQIENEKIERIQELENSRMLFQSINNRSNDYYKQQVVGFCQEEDLRLEDLRGMSVNDNVDADVVSGDNYCGSNNLGRRGGVSLSLERVEESCIEIVDEDSAVVFGDRSINKFVRLGGVCIVGNGRRVERRVVKEVSLEFYDDEYENIKLKNEQIMDLSERVRVLSEEMSKLKEREGMDDNKMLMERTVDNVGWGLDDTDEMIGSATEMFKLALRNIRMNNQGFVKQESDRPKSSTFGEGSEVNGGEEDMEEGGEELTGRGKDCNNDKDGVSRMLMTNIPSEFSFSSNGCNMKRVVRRVSEDPSNQSESGYHQYTSIENKNTINGNHIGEDAVSGNVDKGGGDNDEEVVVVPNTGGLGGGAVLQSSSASLAVSMHGNEISYSQMTKNNPVILQFPMVVRSSSQSQSQSPEVMSRSNSIKYGSGNNNGNIGGYYYKYYNTLGDDIYKRLANTSNTGTNIGTGIYHDNIGGLCLGESNYQKRYTSLPRQNNNIRTIPPPFFPRV